MRNGSGANRNRRAMEVDMNVSPDSVTFRRDDFAIKGLALSWPSELFAPFVLDSCGAK
jgi:hypothetical protein